MSQAKKRRYEPHVRLYAHELNSPAYRALTCTARALLVEFRALYNGQENRVFMSVREAEKRLGVSQRPAQKALTELEEKGFIKLLVRGGFNCKLQRASEYALTSEPLTNRQGDLAPKDYMRWRPQVKNTVVKTPTPSSQNDYSAAQKTTRKAGLSSQNDYREGNFLGVAGSQNDYTDSMPWGGGLLGMAFRVSGSNQLAFILAWLALGFEKMTTEKNCPMLA